MSARRHCKVMTRPATVARGLLVLCVACTPTREPELADAPSDPPPSPAKSDAPDPVVPEVAAPTVVAPTCEPCAPRTIISIQAPSRLAIDDTEVFWIHAGALLKVPRAGGGLTKLAHDITGESVVLSRDAAYGCRARADLDRDIVRVPKAGGGHDVVATAAACQLAIVGEHLYFPVRARGADQQLARMPVGGGAVETIGEPMADIAEIEGDATHVYWHADGGIHRLARATDTTETVVKNAGDRLGPMALTHSHVVWTARDEVMRAPKLGSNEPERIANLQDVLDMASDGTHVFWASVADRRWVRYDPASGTLAAYPVPEGVSSIEVDGTAVVFNRFTGAGKIELLDTCGCGPDTLVDVPAIRDDDLPPDEHALALGQADGSGRLSVQVSEMSADEQRLVAQAGSESPDGIVADADLPERFRRGTRYTVTTSAGSFLARVTGFEAQSGGSGTIFTFHLEGKGTGGTAIVTREGGPVVAEMRAVAADVDAARAVLPGLRTLAKRAGHRMAIGHKHVVAVRGRFPSPHAMLVALVVPVAGEEVPTFVSALWLADADGRLTEEVIGIERGIDSYDIGMLLDIDADGIDEVLFSSEYYEGSFEHLLRWNGETPEFSTIAGDGA